LIGRAYPSFHHPPGGDDIATFCYTSGGDDGEMVD